MPTCGPILLYLFAVAACGLSVMSLCRAVFGDTRRIPLFSISLTCGFPIALLLFSLLARVNPNYEITVPVTLLLLALGCGFGWLDWHEERTFKLSRSIWDRRMDAVFLGVFSIVLLFVLLLRSNWPGIHWDSSIPRYGSEKLFNYSLIQAFLFGRGFPPENLWSAGEPIDYYILLHALPGLVNWAWRVLTGDAGAGGVIFVFSDAFTLMWGCFSLSVWTYSLLVTLNTSLTRHYAALISIALGIGVLLATHTKAIRMVFEALASGTEVGWWQLQDVIPYTVSQYPVWLMIQGDHHAFGRVFFLEISFYGSMILLFLSERFHPFRVALSACLAAILLIANPGSVLLDLVVFVPAVLGIVGNYVWKRQWPMLKIFVLNLLGVGVLALLLGLPTLLTIPNPEVTWYWVETGAASPLSGFLETQFPSLLVVAAAASSIWTGAIAGREILHGKKLWLIVAVLAIPLLLGRAGVAVALACALLVLYTAPRHSVDGNIDRMPLVILGASVFALWIFPEFLVSDFSHRQALEWKRFNVTMRFWLEGNYLIPFLAVLVWAPAYQTAFARHIYVRCITGGAAIVALLWIVVHGYSIADRIRRTPDLASINGTEFLLREAPCDAAIIKHLGQLPESVRIGELCGTGEFIREVPVEYSWAGRIAAYSGRPGICGWSKHVWQFSNKLHNNWPTGIWTWDRFREYERHLQLAFASAQQGVSNPSVRTFFDQLGLTHMIVGDQERRVFPGLTIDALANTLGGVVDYHGENGCGVVALGNRLK